MGARGSLGVQLPLWARGTSQRIEERLRHFWASIDHATPSGLPAKVARSTKAWPPSPTCSPSIRPQMGRKVRADGGTGCKRDLGGKASDTTHEEGPYFADFLVPARKYGRFAGFSNTKTPAMVSPARLPPSKPVACFGRIDCDWTERLATQSRDFGGLLRSASMELVLDMDCFHAWEVHWF